MRVVPQISVTTTEGTSEKLGFKFLRVTVGASDVLFAVSYRLIASRETDFITLNAGGVYLFEAPKGKKIWYVFYKTASGTSTLDIVASETSYQWTEPKKFVATLDASSARTTSVAGTAIDLLLYDEVEVEIIVTAVSGTTPTLDVKVQASCDNNTWTDAVYINGATAITFAQITSATSMIRQFDWYPRYLRLYFTIGGTTPSFTFSTVITAKRR